MADLQYVRGPLLQQPTWAGLLLTENGEQGQRASPFRNKHWRDARGTQGMLYWIRSCSIICRLRFRGRSSGDKPIRLGFNEQFLMGFDKQNL